MPPVKPIVKCTTCYIPKDQGIELNITAHGRDMQMIMDAMEALFEDMVLVGNFVFPAENYIRRCVAVEILDEVK